MNYDKAVKTRPKTPKSDKTQSFKLKPQNETERTTRIKATKKQNENELFLNLQCGYSFPLFAIRKRGKRGKQKLFEIFHKNSLQKEKCVVLCKRKGIPTA